MITRGVLSVYACLVGPDREGSLRLVLCLENVVEELHCLCFGLNLSMYGNGDVWEAHK